MKKEKILTDAVEKTLEKLLAPIDPSPRFRSYHPLDEATRKLDECEIYSKFVFLNTEYKLRLKDMEDKDLEVVADILSRSAARTMFFALLESLKSARDET